MTPTIPSEVAGGLTGIAYLDEADPSRGTGCWKSRLFGLVGAVRVADSDAVKVLLDGSGPEGQARKKHRAECFGAEGVLDSYSIAVAD